MNKLQATLGAAAVAFTMGATEASAQNCGGGGNALPGGGCNGGGGPTTPVPTPTPITNTNTNTFTPTNTNTNNNNVNNTNNNVAHGGAGGSATSSASANNGGVSVKTERPIPMGQVGAMSSATCSNSLNISAPFVGLGGSMPSEWCWNLLEGGANMRAGVQFKDKALAGVGASQVSHSGEIGKKAVSTVITNMDRREVQDFNRRHNTWIGLADRGEIGAAKAGTAFKVSAEARVQVREHRAPAVASTGKQYKPKAPKCNCK